MNKRAEFGVAGNPPHFWESKYHKERANACEWLNEIGLNALEVQCTYGVRMPDKRAELFLEYSKKYNISLSIHAPYYINIGVDKQKTIDNSIKEILKAVKLAKKIDTKKIIFHPGGIPNTREEALEKAIDTLKKVEKDLVDSNVYLYPETAGKVGQLGSVDEILSMCKSVKNVYPCLDLAHVHARENGSLNTKDDFINLFRKVEKQLGKNGLNKIHIHMYPVDYGLKGEICHKAFDDIKQEKQLSLGSKDLDNRYTPRYEPFINAICETNLSPTVICEAKDSQDVGALMMKEYYQKKKDN